MNRPAGVTVSAMFLILGSVLTALMGVLMLFARSFVPAATPQLPYYGVIMVSAAAVLLGFALWGVLTAVGLFRMRLWARTSILVTSALIVIFCCLSLVTLLAAPLLIPEFESIRGMGIVMGIMVPFYLTPIAFGAWWLIYFSRAAVTAAFRQKASSDETPRRPLSIIVIAWHAVIFGLVTFVFLMMHWPAYLFGIVLTGWAADLTYLIFGAIELAIGIGLLKLKPWSLTAAACFCTYAMVDSLVFAIVPAEAARIAEVMVQNQPAFRGKTPVVPEAFWWFIVVVTWVTFGTALWYLFTRKKAFLEAGNSAQLKA